MFYEIKKDSRLTLGFFFAPLAAFLFLFAGEGLGSFLLELFFPRPDDLHALPQAAELFAFAADWLPLLLWARLIEKTPWAAMGIKRKGAGRAFLRGWAWGAGMLLSSVLLMAASGGLKFVGLSFSWAQLARFLLLSAAWTVQSGAEELICRGWLLSSVSARRGVPAGVAVSAAFFTVLHLGNDGIALLPLIDLVLFGVLAALYMLRDNSLFGVTALHAAWNCLQGSFFDLPVSGQRMGEAFVSVLPSGPDWLSGGVFGAEGTVFSILIQLAVIAFLLIKIKKNGLSPAPPR